MRKLLIYFKTLALLRRENIKLIDLVQSKTKVIQLQNDELLAQLKLIHAQTKCIESQKQLIDSLHNEANMLYYQKYHQ